jgi:hypothetical protein
MRDSKPVDGMWEEFKDGDADCRRKMRANVN